MIYYIIYHAVHKVNLLLPLQYLLDWVSNKRVKTFLNLRSHQPCVCHLSTKIKCHEKHVEYDDIGSQTTDTCTKPMYVLQ